MITAILAGLLGASTNLNSLSTPTTEAAPIAQHQEHAATATPDSDTSDVQALIDADQNQAGYEFITVRYDGEFAHIALDPETYDPDSNSATFHAVSQLLADKGYTVTAVL